MSNDSDVSTELLIAQLLQEDLRDIAYAQEAENAQLSQALIDSAHAAGRFSKKSKATDYGPPTDADLALRMLAEEARISSDAAFAQSLQHENDTNVATSRMFALKMAAAEKKFMLDAEFARRLQAADTAGELDIDGAEMMDAET